MLVIEWICAANKDSLPYSFKEAVIVFVESRFIQLHQYLIRSGRMKNNHLFFIL